VEESALLAEDVLYDMVIGNRRFVSGKTINTGKDASPVQILMGDPFNPAVKKAVVLTDAYLDVPMDAVFDALPGEIQSIRVMGYTAGDHDGVMSSVDYAMSGDDSPPVLIVLGDSESEVMISAMRVAMEEMGHDSLVPPSRQKHKFVEESELGLLRRLIPSCRDALLQQPDAPFPKLLEIAAKLNVWNTIQTLMGTSPTVFSGVSSGKLQLHGAYMDMQTGQVQMLGTHPVQELLLQTPPADVRVRTASSPSVPPEEAMAALVTGNRRFTTDKGAIDARVDDYVLMQLGEGGQQPMAVVLGCADSRAPVELMFDKRPGDLFVLRTAGNILSRGKGALLGSTEFAISTLNTKLVVVTGHTQSGFVTEAVKAVRSGAGLEERLGSIGELLADLVEAAQKAVNRLPNASLSDQVALATKLNVHTAMERLIRQSDIIRESVVAMEVQVQGAVYDIVTGEVEWLGEHPNLEEITGQEMPVHTWKTSPYQSSAVETQNLAARQAIERLQEGNEDFANGFSAQRVSSAAVTNNPLAVLVTGTEVPVSLQQLFDTAPGELVVQRCLGNIVGKQGGTLFHSLEYAVVHFAPPVLIVLGYSDDSVIKSNLLQVQEGEVPPFAMQPVLDQVSVSCVRALKQVEGEGIETTAGSDMKVMRLAVEFNVLYSIEQLITESSIVRNAIKEGMEVQGAVLDHLTGKVSFLGPHPMANHLLDLGEARWSQSRRH